MEEEKVDKLALAPDVDAKQETHIKPDQAITILKDGLAVFPNPTSDPLDPLNWSSVRKHSILAVVCLKYFLFTYITTTT